MTSPEYFEDLYAASDDPWQLAEREYERRKFDVTMASLPRARYGRAFEPGCSVGVLTRLLADRCDELLATDPVTVALDQARRRVPHGHVTFARGRLPGDWPDGAFDLVVLSEVMYYLSAADRLDVLAAAAAGLTPDGHLMMVHWRHPFEVATCTGDEAHGEARRVEDLLQVVEHVEDDFRLEVFARA